MGIFCNRQRELKDEDICRPGVGYSVRQLMRLQQSAVIPDGSMINMDSYTPSEFGDFGVNPLNRIGLELDDIQSIKEFQSQIREKSSLAASAPSAPLQSAPAEPAPPDSATE